MKKQALTLVAMMAFTLGARAEQAQPQVAASKTTCYGSGGTEPCRKGPHTRPDIKGEGCPKSFRAEFRGTSLVLGFDDFRVEPNPGFRNCTFVVPVELRGGNWSAQVLNMHVLGQQSLSGPHTVGRVQSTFSQYPREPWKIFARFNEESTQVTSPQTVSPIDAWFSPNESTKTTPASQLDLLVSVVLFLKDNGSASAMTSTWFRIDSVEYGLDWSSDLNLGALRNILDMLQKTSDWNAKQCQKENHPQIAQALTDLTWAAGWLNWDLLQPSFDRGTLAQRAEQLRQKFKTARSWAKDNGQSRLSVDDYNRLITPEENLVNELLTSLGLTPEPVAYPY